MTADEQIRRLLIEANILLLIIAILLFVMFMLVLYAYGDWRKRRDH